MSYNLMEMEDKIEPAVDYHKNVSLEQDNTNSPSSEFKTGKIKKEIVYDNRMEENDTSEKHLSPQSVKVNLKPSSAQLKKEIAHKSTLKERENSGTLELQVTVKEESMILETVEDIKEESEIDNSVGISEVKEKRQDLESQRVKLSPKKVNEVGSDSDQENMDFKDELIPMTNDKPVKRGRKLKVKLIMINGKHKCPHCEKQYSGRSYLLRHVQTKHAKRKPHKCDICNKILPGKSVLYRHIIQVHSIKDYVCDMCDVKCSKKIDFVRHMRTHTGEKPFQCDMCSLSFNRKSNLSLHIQSRHMEFKHFVCDKCNCKFSRKYDLNRHIKRIHTNEKPYVCGLCDFRSVNAFYIKEHVKKVHSFKQTNT